MSILNNKWIPDLTLERKITWPLILVLIGVIFFMSKCDKETELTFEDCETFAINYADSVSLALIRELQEDFNKHLDSLTSSPIEVITEERIVYKDHTTFVKNWEELQHYQALASARATDNKNLIRKLKIKEAEFDSILNANGAFSFESFVEDIEPPIIKQNHIKTGLNYTSKTTTISKDSLLSFDQSVNVWPTEIEVSRKPTKEEIDKAAEALKKNNFLAMKGGAMFIDGSGTMFWTPSLEYGHKWWLLEGGVLVDRNLSKDWYKGFEVKTGVVIRF